MAGCAAKLEPLEVVVKILRDEGAAVVIALMASALLLVIGTGIVLTTAVETGIASNFQSGFEVLYAADAALELSINDLQRQADWNLLLNGSVRSAFVDGSPTGSRSLGDGSRIDLDEIVNLANCLKPTACTNAEMNATTAERPWGVNNPRWHPYAYGSLGGLMGTNTVGPVPYVVVLMGDDPSENDGDPAQDGLEVGGAANPGLGVLLLRAEAFGLRGSHRVSEATVARVRRAGLEAGGFPAANSPGLHVLAWRQLR